MIVGHATTLFASSGSANWLASLERFGIRPGLERINSLFSAMGNPQEGLRLIHVAGTNGKGSVCAMIASCLAEVGLSVGLYTSPHLITPRERIRVNGKAVSSEDFEHLAAMVRQMSSHLPTEAHPTYFEAFTAMAAEYFRQKHCDVVLWETGMGGRLDATNAVNPMLCVITGVDFDHAEHLGGTLAEIAGEKAGILKSCVPAVVGALPPEASAVMRFKASELSAELTSAEDAHEFEKSLDTCGWRLLIDGVHAFLPLRGRHQIQNLRTSIAALRLLSKSIGFEFRKCLRGLENTRWPARMQALPDGSLLDGAHNPQGARSLAAAMAELSPGRKSEFIFGCIEGKKPLGSLAALAPLSSHFHFVPVKWSNHGVNPESLLDMASGIIPGIHITSHQSLAEAIADTNPKRRVIAGSLYLAGEALTMYFSEEMVADLTYDEPPWPFI